MIKINNFLTFTFNHQYPPFEAKFPIWFLLAAVDTLIQAVESTGVFLACQGVGDTADYLLVATFAINPWTDFLLL